MARCAGKAKYLTIFLLGVLLVSPANAQADTAADSPVFRMAGRWLSPFQSPITLNRLPAVEGMDSNDRTAVETILLEAAGDGFSSMVAVGETIRNRASLFRRSAREICLQPKQFSGWNDPVRAEAFLNKHRGHYGRAWLAWKLSATTSMTRGATDYHTLDILPYWASAYTISAQVGSHIFYIRQARRIRD